MLNLKTAAIAAVSAVMLTAAQPKPAEAGDAGKIIAGAALGALAVGILSHAAHDNDYRDHYRMYRYAPYPAYRYYGPRVHYVPRYYYKKHDHHKLSQWERSHPGTPRNWRR